MNNDFETFHFDIIVKKLFDWLSYSLNVHDVTLAILPCFAINDNWGNIATNIEQNDIHINTKLNNLSINEYDNILFNII